MVVTPTDFKPGVPDYSTVHEPCGELFTPVKEKAEWNSFKLSQDQIDQFWRDGYLLNVPLLSEEQCDRILEDSKCLLDSSNHHPGHEMLYEYHINQTHDPSNVLMHCLGHWRLTKLFHDLVFLPSATVPASQLLLKDKETKVRFFHDQMFAKPPKNGANVAWHQDYSYWTRTQPLAHLTVHIALDDQTVDNGPILYVPGSHRWTRNGGPLPVTDFNFVDMESIKSVLSEEEKANFKPVCAMLKKGQASFHHGLSVHGSYGNKSDFPRRATVLNYFMDGVISNTDGELLKDIKVPKGEKMAGQFFPLVYDPVWAE